MALAVSAVVVEVTVVDVVVTAVVATAATVATVVTAVARVVTKRKDLIFEVGCPKKSNCVSSAPKIMSGR